MRTFIALMLLTSISVAQSKFPAGVYPDEEDNKPKSFRDTTFDLTRVGCKLRPDLGSGVNTEYGVITCWHCVSSGKPISVECDGEISQGQVIAKDEANDVALLAVSWTKPHPTVEVATSHPSGRLILVARSAEGSISTQSTGVIGYAFDGLVKVEHPSIAGQSGGGYIDSNGKLAGIVSGNVVDREPFRGLMIPASSIRKILPFKATVPEAAPTPQEEIDRVLNILPKPDVGFVDFGCGAEARWVISAARKYKCKCIGMEIDPLRARLARDRVKAEGLSDLITIYNADSTAYNFDNSADVGVAYLYPETLEKLGPKIRKLKAFASYIHKPTIDAHQSGDSWIYVNRSQPMAIWGGMSYSGPICNNPNCGMCNSIRSQLATKSSSSSGGHYVTQKVKICNGRSCWFEDRQVWVQD